MRTIAPASSSPTASRRRSMITASATAPRIRRRSESRNAEQTHEQSAVAEKPASGDCSRQLQKGLQVETAVGSCRKACKWRLQSAVPEGLQLETADCSPYAPAIDRPAVEERGRRH